MSNKFLALLIAFLVLAAVVSCQKPASENAAPNMPPANQGAKAAQMPPDHPPMPPSGQGMPPMKGPKVPEGGFPVVVPDNVKAAFKAVQVKLTAKDGSFDQTFEAPIDSETKLGDTGLSVKVLAYLPGFYMDQSRITTVGLEETNPAAKVTVFEKGQAIHTGWLFSKMPTVHAFPHEKYSLVMVGSVKK